MRPAVILLAVMQLGFLVLMALDTMTSTGMDAAGRGMAMGFITVYGMVLAVFLVPALILAIVGRGLRIALGLVLAPIVLAVLAVLSNAV